MSYLEAVVLGVIQGLTEFLPVSSSGHLVLAQSLMGVELPGVLFEVVVHLATLCAVCWVYRLRLSQLAHGLIRRDRAQLIYIGMLALATIPAAIVGISMGDTIRAVFESPIVAAGLLLVTGCLVRSIRTRGPLATRNELEPRDALVVGVAQAVAIFPGISRSGSTVAVGTALGIDAIRMAEFSFLLSIPAIGGAAVLQLRDVSTVGAVIGAGPLTVAFAVAAVSGIFAIHIFLRMIEHRTFHRFAYYCWSVGLAYLLAAAIWPELR